MKTEATVIEDRGGVRVERFRTRRGHVYAVIVDGAAQCEYYSSGWACENAQLIRDARAAKREATLLARAVYLDSLEVRLS